MVKNSAQDPQDNSLQMKTRQYLVSGRRLPSKEDPNPKVISMRIFARNTVAAKADFGGIQEDQINLDHHMVRFQQFKNCLKEETQMLRHMEQFLNTNQEQQYTICIRNSEILHQMVQCLNYVCIPLINSLDQEMAGNHRAQPQTIHILRTSVLTKSADIKRGKTNQYRGDSIKFPIVKTVPRASHKNSELYLKQKDQIFIDHDDDGLVQYQQQKLIANKYSNNDTNLMFFLLLILNPKIFTASPSHHKNVKSLQHGRISAFKQIIVLIKSHKCQESNHTSFNYTHFVKSIIAAQ